MNITPKKLLQNIYFAALHHKNSAYFRMNDLVADDLIRWKDRGSFDAYSHIVQMIEQYDTMGGVDYKKTFKMKEELPYFLNKEKQKNMAAFREYLKL